MKLLNDVDIRMLEEARDTEETLTEIVQEAVETAGEIYVAAETTEEMIEESSMDISMENEISELEKSFLNLSIVQEEEVIGNDIVESFGFLKFVVPPLICRHPPPATGRDDDISKIREILDDILLKMGYLTNVNMTANRIFVVQTIR